MPNWTPSPEHIHRVLTAVNDLTNRRAGLMETDYPLSADQVLRIVTPPRLQEFIKLGYDSLQRTGHICYELGPNEGMGRHSITRVSLPVSIQYAFSRQLDTLYRPNQPCFFNREGIDDEAMAQLKEWTDKAVYERRLQKLVNETVTDFFSHRGKEKLSMYHIMARWPGLRVVFTRAGGNYRGGDMWERHGNEVPRNLQRWNWPQYGPEAEWRARRQKRLELVEETLLSCVSLKPIADRLSHNQPRKLTARVTDWQVLGGAPF